MAITHKQKLFAAFAVGALTAAAGIWAARQVYLEGPLLGPSGRYKDSPDHQYRAWELVHNGWCSMEVIKIATGERLYYVTQTYGPKSKRPRFDQGDSNHDGIVWDANSGAVTFQGADEVVFLAPIV